MGHYYCGDHQVEVVELREIRAVPPGSGDTIKPEWLVREDIFHDRPEQLAFEYGNWRFVYLKDVEGHIPPEHLKRVYRRVAKDNDTQEGPLAIFSGRISVRFDPETAKVIAEPKDEYGDCCEDLQRCLCDKCDVPIAPDPQQPFGRSLYNVLLQEDADPLEAVASLRDVGGVLRAEPEMFQYMGQRSHPRNPRMPRAKRQWHWENTGHEIPHSKPGADVKAVPAWGHGAGTTGRGITIAVIDTGMDVNHPDLRGALYVDANGDVRGGHFEFTAPGTVSFVPGTANFPPSPHGTAVAGMAAARRNTRPGGLPFGVHGIAYEATLLPIGTVHYGIDSQQTLARAIEYAVDSTTDEPGKPAVHADIIVISLGPNHGPFEASDAVEDAIALAVSAGRGGRGIPIFWAVANASEPLTADHVVSLPEVIAVGKTNAWDVVEETAFGDGLNFVAPGVNVHTTVSGGVPAWGNYLSVTGTSFAAPCAAGVAALMLQVKPELTWDQVRDLMQESCFPVGAASGRVVYDAAGRHPQYGHGRVDAFEAVKAAQATPPAPAPVPPSVPVPFP